jgi:hypothetical protein
VEWTARQLPDEGRARTLRLLSARWLSLHCASFVATRLMHTSSGDIRLTGWFGLKLSLLWRLCRVGRAVCTAALWIVEGFSQPYTMLGI